MKLLKISILPVVAVCAAAVFAIQFMAAFHYSGFPGLMGMTDMMRDILYWACCILPFFYTNRDKK